MLDGEDIKYVVAAFHQLRYEHAGLVLIMYTCKMEAKKLAYSRKMEDV